MDARSSIVNFIAETNFKDLRPSTKFLLFKRFINGELQLESENLLQKLNIIKADNEFVEIKFNTIDLVSGKPITVADDAPVQIVKTDKIFS